MANSLTILSAWTSNGNMSLDNYAPSLDYFISQSYPDGSLYYGHQTLATVGATVTQGITSENYTNVGALALNFVPKINSGSIVGNWAYLGPGSPFYGTIRQDTD